MSFNRQSDALAFDYLLGLAQNRFDVLERALSECRRAAGGRDPTFAAVEERLKRFKTEEASNVSRTALQMDAARAFV